MLDRDLPGIHGDTLCQMITESDEPAMILMLTASGAPEDRVSGLGSALMTTCPNRSISLNSCCACARSPAASRQPQPGRCEQPESSSTRQQEASLEIDARSTLTAKECAVLEALLRASPAGLSAEKLLEQAWDENADPFTNTVRVTIARLRHKLGDPQVIQTTPGIGYHIANTQSESGSNTDA